MPAAREIPQRNLAYFPKVSTGCLTCKARKIKCDQGLPDCQKCSKAGRKCSGYAKHKRPSTSQQLPTPEVVSDSLNTLSLSAEIEGSDQELRSFEFFRSYTVPQLCGFFDSNFWSRVILQATHQQPAIRHAAIALGSMHRELETNSSGEQTLVQKDFALQQYLKAIRCLVEPMQGQVSQRADLALMTCVLFVCFENLRGHYGSALSHIKGAIKILAELQSSKDTSRGFWMMSSISHAPLKTFNLIFGRLEAQILLIKGDRRVLIEDAMDDKETGYEDYIPTSFMSLDHARNAIDHIWTAHSRCLKKEIPQWTAVEEFLPLVMRSKRRSTEKLIAWSKAFERFLCENRQTLSHASQITIHVLKIQMIFTDVIFSVDVATSLRTETVWDAYFQEFEAIIAHSSAVVKLESQLRGKSKGGKSTSPFALDSGLVIPLVTVATKCRHHAMRRKAISILRSPPRYEGVLSSVLASRIVERWVDIEEETILNPQFSEDIPDEKRVTEVQLNFDTEGNRVFLKFKKWKEPGVVQGETIDVCMDC